MAEEGMYVVVVVVPMISNFHFSCFVYFFSLQPSKLSGFNHQIFLHNSDDIKTLPHHLEFLLFFP